ncbi:TIGR01212 family radical SAM protein [Thermotoga profunda]|uniref:TIGR01212 family radical SAM protein n=1 Tax=Thermotoga profunda TaxID=1508420 RepID=UPI000B2582C9|nr:TIGR01212 family radical SAM protein [Thermotoga profunda]
MSNHLKQRYGAKVHRLIIDAGFTCPNREKSSPCIFCDPTGSGFNAFHSLSIREQVEKQRQWAISKYKAEKFIVYFQAFTNTYAPVDVLKRKYEEAIIDKSIVQLAVSTRPDCVQEPVLEILESFKSRVDVSLELGLQTINPKTLRIIKRGHGLAEFIDAVLRVKKHNLEIVVHVIVDLPWDEIEDVIDTARTISCLGVDGVKLHSLYVVKGTELEKLLKTGQIQLLSFDQYKDRVIAFLENLSENIVIHRLASDPPKDMTIVGNWGMSKLEVVNKIEKELEIRNTCQGKNFKRWLHSQMYVTKI